MKRLRHGLGGTLAGFTLLFATVSTPLFAQEIVVITHLSDSIALDAAARTNWMAKIIPPGLQNFRNDAGPVGFVPGPDFTNLSPVVDGVVTTYPLEIIETTSSPVSRLVYDAAGFIVLTSTPAGYSQWTWTTNTYGSPGAWVTGTELDAWKAERSPTRERIILQLISTSDIPAYRAQLTNSVGTVESNGTNLSLLVLYSNEIAFVGLTPAPVPNGLLHAPTNITRLDIFTTTNLLSPRGGWGLHNSRDNTTDPLYIPFNSLNGFMGMAVGNANVDTDGDTISDAREQLLYGSDPFADDSDFDGLTDREEIFTYGTNPFLADTDGDGISDSDEINSLFHPAKDDTDGDGLKDNEELTVYFTDALNVDTDSDGVTDFAEVSTYGSFPRAVDSDGDGLTDSNEVFLGTNPRSADTDSDGMDDKFENDKSLNPTSASDAAQDLDGDGLSNLTEYQWGVSISVSNGVPENQELVARGAGSNAIQKISAANTQMAVGDCGAHSAFVRVRPFKDGGSNVVQKLVFTPTNNVFINGTESSTLSSPLVIQPSGTAAVFFITASRAAKGSSFNMRLTNDVGESAYYDDATFHIPQLEWVKFYATVGNTQVYYGATGILNVALSSDTNATRIYLQEHAALIAGDIPTPHLTDWIRVRVTGPGATLTNTTLNSLDHLSAYATSYSGAKTHGIKILQPGTHKIEVGFDMNANGQLDDDEVEETCLVNALKVTVAWEAIDSALDTNPNWGGGLRIFPDNQSPTDTVNRTKVRLRATVEPATPNVTIHFKAFDVDDPTPALFELSVIDPNFAKGDDNFGTPQPGTLSTNKAVTGTNGQATIDFTVTMQPGDNFRIAASTVLTELNKLTVQKAGTNTYVKATNTQVASFSGHISDMLTVWRRLWLEFDSMGPVATNGAEKNFEAGTIDGLETNSPSIGLSTLDVGMLLSDDENRFQEGFIVMNDGVKYPVISNTDNSVFDDSVVITGTPPTSVVSNAFQLFDDDYSDTTGLLRREMPYAISGGTLITNAFSDAFILPVHAPSEYIQTDATFIRNLSSDSTNWLNIVTQRRSLSDSTNFWAATLLVCWQGKIETDFDPSHVQSGPDLEVLVGESFDTPNVGAIYVEPLREFDFVAGLIMNEEHAVVHEIGHQGGGDHNDKGILTKGAPIDQNRFAPITIKRFRSEASY